MMEKQDEKKMGIERKASDQPNIQTKNTKSTQGDKRVDHMMEEDRKYILKPSPGMTGGPLSPLCLDAEMNP